ncbi:magnesium transporter [Myroides odoratimimus]|uniref:Magnesium transporter MgtE n=3 Tax=Myroides odoratimimus TaxID=76832 RepID=A0A0S7E6X3_9FLAO|nr:MULTISPECIES: magnesium transporter [Myroides]AJA68225.1 magnesium transport protein MgtE [Myroides sp. A21]ALU25525.1 magnesium transporter [Myroides odoratimimus]APA91550.1 magnesium transporter [Myroides sp. ZB35]EHO10927.1 magnesium transporter [Myroides odoratimimus CCUG 10230]EHO15249.1 magnesium transporter [Myroides odoratimimus CCUG 12901]
MEFKISRESLQQFEDLIAEKNEKELLEILKDLHYADIAEIMNELSGEEAIYIFDILDSEVTAEILLELNEDVREKILKTLSPKEIAEELDELDTDDAADIISELPESKKEEVLSELEDLEHAKDIVELLRYDEDTAGGLMAKEYVSVNENWSVLTCVKEMRKQAEHVSRVHSIYVIDNEGRLKGRLSLKDLLTSSTTTHISDVYIRNVDSVKVDTKDVEVARIMQKYDLEAIPVIDEMGRLVGRITIDDIVDVIKEEADKDYQLAAGISQDVEANDSILMLTRARLPWLILAMIGGFVAVNVSRSFEGAMEKFGVLFFFTPLIAAMAGNVGVQSSAIIVQGLANNSITGSIWKRLGKEVTLSLLNGFLLAILMMLGSHFLLGVDYIIGITVSIALISVIIIASLIGTFVPILLNKYGIDPALATGPFITTSNDIFGILIYFSIAKVILGF